MEDITMRKIFQYIMLAVVTIVMASCTSDIEETTATTGKNNVQLVVGEFPAFGDSQTRAIGTPDEGKTSWAEGDELLLEMTSKTLETKYAAFKYNGSSWELTSGELSYKEDEVPTFPHVYYAPNYKWEAGKLVLKEGKVAGTDEYIEGKANITPNGQGINVSFADATRNYSRLRIATMPNKPITVDITKFTPAGSSSLETTENYTLVSDEKGNAYLYGTFEKKSEVTVKYKETSLCTHTFKTNTDNGKSYVLDATVVSANSIDEIKAVIAQKIADGDMNIRLNLASDAGFDEFEAIRTAVDNALLHDGTIDLTIIGVETIPNYVFRHIRQLKSVKMSDVKEIEERAFFGCEYLIEVEAPSLNRLYSGAFMRCDRLSKLTFGPIDYADEKTLPIFNEFKSEVIDLILSDYQKEMVKNGLYYTANDDKDYAGSDEHNSKTFLGYRFKSITCRYPVK